MSKPQLAIRIPPPLLADLNRYVEQTGTSKTDVVISAIAQYIGHTGSVALGQRIVDMEKRLTELENLVGGKC